MGNGIQLRDVQSCVEMTVIGNDLRLQVVTNINTDIGNDGIGPCGLKAEHNGKNLSIKVEVGERM